MYRFFEILPAALAWLTIILMFLLSWLTPAFAAVFIILFDVYWLLKSIYLSIHLRHTFSEMKVNLAIDWLAKLKSEKAGRWEDIWHLVLMPMATEPYEVVRESFESLAKTNYPKDKFIVVLATEARLGEKAQEVARRIEKDFGDKFGRFLRTTHPADLSGEIPGKGSNEAWAAKEVKRLIIDPLISAQSPTSPLSGIKANQRENNAKDREKIRTASQNNSHSFASRSSISYDRILTSVFDIDTQVPPEYFGRLTCAFLETPNNLRVIYQPIPFFVNNIYQAPALARVVSFSATFWQMMQQARPERLTAFSSQSLPFRVVVDIDFWQKDIVSEDSRVFWQGYLRYHGDFRVVPLCMPVFMDANVAPTFWRTMINIYKQQRRWAWGVENTPYLLTGFLRDSIIPLSKKWYWALIDIEGRHAWATNSLLIFALGWLPLLLGGDAFNASLLSYNLPRLTRYIIDVSMIGIATSAILSVVLLPPKPKWIRFWHYPLYILQWALLPITLIVFGALPALDAQTRLALGGKFRLGFWVTPKGR
ncbi:MAG: hypothetical protein AAB686_02745 [Patescibacteria group bacterium]